MSVVFEFQVTNGFQFSSQFAQHSGLAPAYNQVELPRVLGEGFIWKVYLNKGLFLCQHYYHLKQEFTLKCLEVATSKMLTLKFHFSQFKDSLKAA